MFIAPAGFSAGVAGVTGGNFCPSHYLSEFNMFTETAVVVKSNKAKILGALGSEVRISIVELLFRCGEVSVSECAAEIGVPLVNASHHLRLMRDAGVLLSRREGREMFYSLFGASGHSLIYDGLRVDFA